MAKRTVTLQISVQAPDDMDADEVAGLVNKMLDIGYGDATDTYEDCDQEILDEVQRALSLDVEAPVVTHDQKLDV